MVHQCEDERDPRVKRLHLLPMREAEQRRVCRGASTDWLALWEVLPEQHLMPLCAVYEKVWLAPYAAVCQQFVISVQLWFVQ